MVQKLSLTGVRTLGNWITLSVLVVMPVLVCSDLAAHPRPMDDDVGNSELQSKGLILNALTFGAGASGVNISTDGCEWRRGLSAQFCPDPAIKFYLYTSFGSQRRELNPEGGANTLMAAGWVQQHHTIVLIHGYGGGDNTIPISILRDAYLRRGDFNVIVVDWGALAPVPCYPAAVHNSAHVGKCVAAIPKMLRDAGAATDAWTCVGHSLGAHVCGTMSDYLSFRVHKIIGLDPARPLVRPISRFRLDPSDAAVVHVLHTDAGHYGEMGRLGTADFCVNGGRTQPHCRLSVAGEHVCNHVSAVCFLAESLDPRSALVAEQCSSRRCPAARSRPGITGSAGATAETARVGGPIQMGHYSPASASGIYCASSSHMPYCPRKSTDRGHPKCCVTGVAVEDNTVSPTLISDKHDPEPIDAPGFLGDPEPSPTVQTTPIVLTETKGTTLPNVTSHPSIGTSSDMKLQPLYEHNTTGPSVVTLASSLSTTPQPSPPTSTSASAPSVSRPADNRVVLVLPSTEITTATTAPPSTQKEAVFPVYSTVAETSTGRILVVMATPLKNTSLIGSPITRATDPPPVSVVSMDPRPFMPVSPPAMRPFPSSPFPSSMFSSNPFPSNPFSSSPFPSSPFPSSHQPSPPPDFVSPTQDEFLTTDMVPPRPTVHEAPQRLPPAIVPVPESLPVAAPGAPDDGDAPIPMAGSLTGSWVPMVMLPPTPFSTDSWKIRSSTKLAPVRRSTYRNYIYD